MTANCNCRHIHVHAMLCSVATCACPSSWPHPRQMLRHYHHHYTAKARQGPREQKAQTGGRHEASTGGRQHVTPSELNVVLWLRLRRLGAGRGLQPPDARLHALHLLHLALALHHHALPRAHRPVAEAYYVALGHEAHACLAPRALLSAHWPAAPRLTACFASACHHTMVSMASSTEASKFQATVASEVGTALNPPPGRAKQPRSTHSMQLSTQRGSLSRCSTTACRLPLFGRAL